MPVGPYEDFSTCITAIMQKQDVDRDTASAICGKMEKGAVRSEKAKQAVMKQRQAQAEGYEDPVIWWSVLDDRTCTVCEALHGDVYEREDAENHFPAHVNCRCELYTELTDPDVYGNAEQDWIIPAALTTTIVSDLHDIVDDSEEAEYNAILPSSTRHKTKPKPKARGTVSAGLGAAAQARAGAPKPEAITKKKSAKLDSLVKSVPNPIARQAKVINTKKPIEVLPLKPEDEKRLFIKTFLIDASISGNAWGVSRKSIVDNIQTFIGKPLVLYKNAKGELDHPPDANAQTIADWNTIQEPFRIGTIIDIVRKEQYNQGPHDDQYFAIIEVTDKDARDVLHSTNQTLYVSPALADLHRNLVANRAGELVGEESDTWIGMHLALVREPAYGIKKAQITAKCGGSEEACITQLRKARLAKQYCGFCVRSALLGVTSQVTNSGNLKALTLSEQEDTSKKEETKTTTQTTTEEKKVEASDIEKENAALKQKIAVLETKLSETSEQKQTLTARIASLEEREIARVVAKKVKEPEKQKEKIRLYVAKGLTASDVEDLYVDLPDINITPRKARLASEVGGGRATLGQAEESDEDKTIARKLIAGGMY